MRLLLGAGRKDKSGDFAKGADLTPDAIDRVLAFTIARRATNAQTLTALAETVASSERGLEGVEELRAIDALAKAAGYNESRLLLDPSVVRGLEYYTGPVFEADLTLTAKDTRANPSVSAPLAAAAVTTGWSGVSGPRMFPRPAFPSVCRGCSRRSRR